MTTRVSIKIPYNEAAHKELAEVPGRRWDPINNCWWIPPQEIFNAASKLEKYFPNMAQMLRKSPRYKIARDKAYAFVKSLEDSRKSSVDNTALLNIPCPKGERYKKFQVAGISFAVDPDIKRKSVLFADEMGLGKTIQAIGVINFFNTKKNLVICPATAKINWQREMDKWVTNPRLKTVTIFSPASRWMFHRYNNIIINYDILNKYKHELYSVDWDTITMDEAHKVKNPDAIRSIITRQLVENIPFSMALTGTPITSRPKDLWNIINLLDPETWNNIDYFHRRYCDAHRDHHGRWNYNGASNLGELQRKLRGTIMVRRLKKDVAKELPRKVRQIIEIPAHKYKKFLGAEKKYQEAIKKVAEDLKNKDNITENFMEKAIKMVCYSKNMKVGDMAKIRHETALAKVPEVVLFIKEILENVSKVIVFAHHRDVVGMIYKAFPGKAVMLYGGMSKEKKQQAQDAFQKNPRIKIFVGNIVSAGVAINLQAADTVVFAELDWVPGNLSQAEDRAHRIGQLFTVSVYHLVLEGSLDAYMAKVVVEKQNNIDLALDKEEKAYGMG